MSSIDIYNSVSRRSQLGQTTWYGIVAATVADMADLVRVVIPEFDEHLVWGPCPWQSRDSVSLPEKGDHCLVVFDNRRNPWVTAWWPDAFGGFNG